MAVPKVEIGSDGEVKVDEVQSQKYKASGLVFLTSEAKISI